MMLNVSNIEVITIKMFLNLEHIRSISLTQCLAVVIVNFITAGSVIHIVWSSPAVPLLTSSDSPIGVQLTGEEASWVTSSVMLGAMPGSIIGGVLLDKFGRQKTLWLASFLLFVPWLIIIFFGSFVTLISMRIIAGIGCGISISTTPLYLGEISGKNIRGLLSTTITIASVAAIVIALGIGPFTSFTTLLIICSSIPGLSCAAFYFVPESPYYLIKTNQNEAAKNVINKLFQNENVEECLKEIQSTVEEDESDKLTLKKLIVKRNYRNSFLIIIALKTLQQFNGAAIVDSYTQTIMQESQTSLPAEVSSLIVSVIQIPCALMSALLVDKLGRRPLLIISAIGCAIALTTEGVYFYLLEIKNIDLSSVYFLPTLCLVMFNIMTSLGMSSLIYVVVSELFATNVKSLGGIVFGFYSSLLQFVGIKSFNPMKEAWGIYTAFWIFAIDCVLVALFGLFVLPETKGKSFEEIQEILSNKRKINKNSNISDKI